MGNYLNNNTTLTFIKELKYTSLFKVLSVLLNFAIVSYTLKFLGTSYYGIWSTLITLTSWIFFFDLGISNGIRNDLSKALSDNNQLRIKEISSTGYIISICVSLALFIAFVILNYLINWPEFFNFHEDPQDLYFAINITIVFGILNFVLSMIKSLLFAYNLTSIVVFLAVLFQVISLLFFFILNYSNIHSLTNYSFAYGLASCLSTIIISAWFFGKQKGVIPEFKYFRLDLVKPLFSVGLKFFLIQLAALVIFSTDKVIISKFLGPAHVTVYDIVYKVFNIPIFLSSIIMAPLWASFTNATNLKDIDWIKTTFKKLHQMMLLICLTSVIIIILFPYIIQIWLDNPIEYELSFVVLMAVFAIVFIWGSIYSTFLNSINQLTIQLISSLFSAGINIPLAILFCKNLGWGLNGVLLATIISTSIFGIIGPIQTRLFLKSLN